MEVQTCHRTLGLLFHSAGKETPHKNSDLQTVRRVFGFRVLGFRGLGSIWLKGLGFRISCPRNGHVLSMGLREWSDGTVVA